MPIDIMLCVKFLSNKYILLSELANILLMKTKIESISGIEIPINSKNVDTFFLGIKKINLRAKYICKPIKDINEINY